MGFAQVIVVDSSALIAVANKEAQWREIGALMSRHTRFSMSPVNLVEARMVAERLASLADVDRLIRDTPVAIVPVDAVQAEAAWMAFKRFGKGRHAAALNLADCFAYALAQVSEAPLLYIGADFAKTDVRSPLA
jgi:ribonuclease VapC